MDTEMAASRRMKVVAGHFSPAADELCPPPHTAVASACLLPMNCSSNVLNTIMPPRRCDNRTYFARQSSSSQSFYMRQQAPVRKQERPLRCPAAVNETPSSAPLFSRPRTAAADPNFCRQAAVAPSTNNFVHSSRMYQLPEHSRPCSSSPISSLLPEFAKPAAITDGCGRSTRAKQLPASVEANCSSRSSGNGWLPKIDVSESAGCFLVTVEIPGGDIRDMRVEVDDHNLRIMGKKCLPAMAQPTYHRKEILQGPYQILWPLPSCSNKDSVSAEFVNGLLHVTVPKL